MPEEDKSGGESAENQAPAENQAAEPINTSLRDLTEFSKRGTEVFPQTPIQAAPADYTPEAPAALLDSAPVDSGGGGGEGSSES